MSRRSIARVVLGDLEAAIYEHPQLNPNTPSSDGPFVVIGREGSDQQVELTARQAGLLADFCRAASFAGNNRRR